MGTLILGEIGAVPLHVNVIYWNGQEPTTAEGLSNDPGESILTAT